ncbi:MAG: translation initiation factor IF-2 [Legionellales bacterium]|nr:translation initiation factor IF-2 [Legionellales bacterium]
MMNIKQLSEKLNMPASVVVRLIEKLTGKQIDDLEQEMPNELYNLIIKELSPKKSQKPLGLNSTIEKKKPSLSLKQPAKPIEQPKLETKTSKPTTKKTKPAIKMTQGSDSLKESGQFTKPSSANKTLTVKVPETISVSELAHLISVKAPEVIKSLMNLGILATINQMIDQDTAEIVLNEMGHQAIRIKDTEESELLDAAIDTDLLNIETRPPVVVVMGHVDHGKTSLLDNIRGTNVVSSEAGGISQHIGAYQIEHNGKTITFMDTPGHEAFTEMRARGSKATDIAILLVAADDGIKPQTVEAIQHAKAAEVPIIVAINKIDKPGVDIDKVTNELSSHNLIPESWGGDTLFNAISAKTGEGIDSLLENILLVAEISDLKAPTNGICKGVVLESRLDKGRGPISTLLIQEGTLKKGDVLLVGQQYGKIRQIQDCKRKILPVAKPSMPVEILGLSGTTLSGDSAICIADEKKARNIAIQRQGKNRIEKLNAKNNKQLDTLFDQMSNTTTNQLNIILKTDMFGTCEAIRESLSKMANESVSVKVVYSGVGAISESDVNLAIASQAIIIGFNVRADAVARKHAHNERIEIHYYNIIYDMISHVKQAITGMIEPRYEDKIIGQASVKEVFKSSKFGFIAGCLVTEGKIKRQADIRVIRDSTVIFTGQIQSLRRFQNDAEEVKESQECGVGIKDYKDIKAGDVIEASIREKVAIIVD